LRWQVKTYDTNHSGMGWMNIHEFPHLPAILDENSWNQQGDDPWLTHPRAFIAFIAFIGKAMTSKRRPSKRGASVGRVEKAAAGASASSKG